MRKPFFAPIVLVLLWTSLGFAEGPKKWTLTEAVERFRAVGYDMLLAKVEVKRAEADLSGAGAIANPAVSFAYGRVLNYTLPPGCDGCSKDSYTIGLSDQGAITSLIFGKRGLRKDVAEAALQVAQSGRKDAQRLLEAQLKAQFIQAALAQSVYDLAISIRDSATKTFELQKLRYPKVIDEGTLARFETTKLDAEHGVDAQTIALYQAQIGLAFLLGVTEPVATDGTALNFAVPAKLSAPNEQDLVLQALRTRPDLVGLTQSATHAQAMISSAKREVVPDFTISLQYTQTGIDQAALQPPTFGFGIGVPLPIFYQNQGDIRRGEAELESVTLQKKKALAQVETDVRSALKSFAISKQMVERMETTYLERAKKAKDITELQYNAGSASLIDFLDAQRIYNATKSEYLQDLAGYWSAVFQLEQAVGQDLR